VAFGIHHMGCLYKILNWNFKFAALWCVPLAVCLPLLSTHVLRELFSCLLDLWLIGCAAGSIGWWSTVATSQATVPSKA